MKYSIKIILLLWFSCWGNSEAIAQHLNYNLDSLIQALPEMPEDSTKVNVYKKIAHTYGFDQPEKSMLYLEKGKKLARTLDYYYALANLYNFEGGIYRIYGENEKALEDLLIATKYYKKINDKIGISNSLSNLAAVYYDSKQDSLAMLYAQQSLEIKNEINDTTGIAYTIIGIALIHSRMNDTQAVFDNYAKAKKLFEATKDTGGLINLYANYSTTHQQLSEYEVALEYCIKCKDLAKQLNYKRDFFNALHCILVSKANLGQLATAEPILDTLLNLAKELGDLLSLRGAYKDAKLFYKEIGNSEKALAYSELYQQYTDSLYQQEQEKEKERLATIFKLKKSEDESEQLLEKQQQQKSIIQQQQISFIIAISAFLLILVLAFYLYQVNQKMRKNNRKLKQQQEEISHQKKELEDLNRTKDQLFSIISHDLIAPLSTLNGLLTLQKEGAMPQEELPQFLEMASAEVTNTTVFLRNLLYWAKNQMDGITAEPEHFDFSVLVQQQIQFQEGATQSKHLSISSDIDTPKIVFADRDLINTVLRNLLMNAIKFTPEGGRINVSAQEQGEMLQVAVCDTGVGIPVSEQTKILGQELYSTRGTNNEKGTGLGLKLCQDFIAKSDGKLWFESSPNQGTTFYFTLPTQKKGISEADAEI